MVNWGIIGLGNIAGRFAASLQHSRQGRLYAAASRQAAKRQLYAKEYAGIKTYATYSELLQDGNVDAVYIALPHSMHKRHSIAALSAGKAVLCEKPATLTAAEFKEVMQCARDNNAFFMEAMKTRFVPMMDKIVADLSGGIIGQVCSVYACFCNRLELDMLAGSFITDPAQGGALLDVGPYPVSFVMDILGCEVLDITADIHKNDNGLILYAHGRMTFPGGAVGEIEAAIDRDMERTAIITGSEGIMRVPMCNRPEAYTVDYNDGRNVEARLAMQHDDMFGEIEEVHRCLQARLVESPRWTWAETLKAMEIIDAMRCYTI